MTPSVLEPARSVGVLGAGVEGLAAMRWLRQVYPDLPRCLLTNAAEVVLPSDLAGERVERSEVTPARLRAFDAVIRSPGFSPYRSPLRELNPDEPPVVTSGSNLWRAHHPQARCIVVTGTKGKSTVASMIAAMLNADGIKATLAGNIGQPLLATEPADWNVLELSSYQLCDFTGHVDLAVVTNLFPEHLDWHGGYANYRNDKLRWLQHGADQILYPAGEASLREALDALGVTGQAVGEGGVQLRDGRLLTDSGEVLLEADQWPLAGAHNRRNGLLAAVAAMRVGVSAQAAMYGLRSFSGLPHRFEVCAQWQRWRFIDDSIATTPHATLAAIEALPEGEPCLLLVGGQDRGVDWEVFYQRARSLPLLGVIGLVGGEDNNARRILARLEAEQPELRIGAAQGVQAAVAMAGEWIRSYGDSCGAVVLSPGAPSHDQYRDYRDRGEQFARAAQSWCAASDTSS